MEQKPGPAGLAQDLFFGSQVSEQALSLNLRAYAAHSYRGAVKPFNEDRILIAPRLSNDHPDISLFAVFDGHGGHGCAEYLKEMMPRFIDKQECLKSQPEQALKNAFKEAEEEFMRKNEVVIKDRSGSCACLVMVKGDQVYTANVGDSRAVISTYSLIEVTC